jgi:hypothetical protein
MSKKANTVGRKSRKTFIFMKKKLKKSEKVEKKKAKKEARKL